MTIKKCPTRSDFSDRNPDGASDPEQDFIIGHSLFDIQYSLCPWRSKDFIIGHSLFDIRYSLCLWYYENFIIGNSLFDIRFN